MVVGVFSFSYLAVTAQDLIENAVYREVVLNLRAGDNSVFVIKINSPYDMTVDLSENTIWSG